MDVTGNSDAGILIRDVREQLGWTQADLAKKLNHSASTVSNMENSPIIKTSTIQRALGAMGYDVVYLAVRRTSERSQCADGVRDCHGMHGDDYHPTSEVWRP